MFDSGAPGPPHINAGEEEQPDHIDEMPVPSGELETKMLFGCEMSGKGTDQANDQEQSPDQNVETVEARRHEEGRPED